MISQGETIGLCSVCFREVRAHRYVGKDGFLYIIKECPEHGTTLGIREKNPAFDEYLRKIHNPYITEGRNRLTFINVNNKCNIRCPQCYHNPSQKEKDISIEDILKVVDLSPDPEICFLGAEATVRPDLAELITEIVYGKKKRVSMVTNGIRFANERYLNHLINAGLYSIAISIHTPSYNGDEIYKKKIRAIENILASSAILDYLAVSIRQQADVPLAFDNICKILGERNPRTSIRLRITEEIGDDPGTGYYLSDLAKWFCALLEEKNIPLIPLSLSNPYLLAMLVEGRIFCLLSWPSIASIDLGDLAENPVHGLLIPELGLKPLIHQGLLFSHLRNGGKIDWLTERSYA